MAQAHRRRLRMPATVSDPLAPELARCQAIGMAAKDDAACEAAWAENRRRFFTYRPADSAASAPPTRSEAGRQARGSVGGMGGTGVIDNFLGVFTQYIDSGFGLVQGDVRWLAGVLIAIDITLAGLFWAMAPDEDVLARLIKKTLYIGVFAFIIGNFNNLAQIIYNSFAGLGIEAGGGTMSQAQLLQPGRLAQVGITAGQPILNSISGLMGFTSFFDNFIQIAILLIAWLIVVISFFIMAIQLFISLIEFKLTTLAGFVLVPFGLFGRTAFLAEKVLGNVVSSGVKVLVLAVIVGIGSNDLRAVHQRLQQPAHHQRRADLDPRGACAARPHHLRPWHRQRPHRRRAAAWRRCCRRDGAGGGRDWRGGRGARRGWCRRRGRHDRRHRSRRRGCRRRRHRRLSRGRPLRRRRGRCLDRHQPPPPSGIQPHAKASRPVAGP